MVLYNAVVLPHLDYCSVVWANCTKKLQTDSKTMVCESYYRYLPEHQAAFLELN